MCEQARLPSREERPTSMAKEGIPFLILSLALVILAYFAKPFLAIPFIFLFLFIAYFFRNPKRVSPEDEQLLVSPADGKVVECQEVNDPRFFEGPANKIAIFMSPLDVHVNRAPSSGMVEKVEYKHGKYLMAWEEKASDANERNAVFLQTHQGKKITFVQIAGFLARRIICDVKRGSVLKKGQRFGIIRFGSRVDVYLPLDLEVLVQVGDRLRAGESVIAKFPAKVS